MNTPPPVGRGSLAPARSALSEQLARGLSAAAGQRSDPVRMHYTLIIDVDHLVHTGQTRRILSLGRRRE
jgi:hypothetical protein